MNERIAHRVHCPLHLLLYELNPSCSECFQTFYQDEFHLNFEPKMAHLPQMRSFFQKNHQCISHVPLSPLHCAKFQKKFLERIQNENFFGKTINIISICLLAPFIVQNFQKILRADQNYRTRHF